MKRFLTLRDEKTPPSRDMPEGTRREEFANAVAAFRHATGKAETRIVPCRCAVNGEPFAILFERMSPAHRFQIARIERNEATGNEHTINGGLTGRKSAQQSYDAGEFDWTGCVCPHCGNRAGVVYCNGCGDTVCAGRVRPLPDGGQAFACHDRCGATGRTEPARDVHGGTGNSRATPQRLLLTGPATTPRLLPGPARTRMLGGKTQ